MYGGHGNRKFYVTEIHRIETEHKNRLPKSRISDEEIQAGFERLNTKYGFFSTLNHLEKELPFTRDQIERWSVREFHYQVEYLRDLGEVTKRYSDIITKRK